jgi:hypothetical protein
MRDAPLTEFDQVPHVDPDPPWSSGTIIRWTPEIRWLTETRPGGRWRTSLRRPETESGRPPEESLDADRSQHPKRPFRAVFECGTRDHDVRV